MVLLFELVVLLNYFLNEVFKELVDVLALLDRGFLLLYLLLENVNLL